MKKPLFLFVSFAVLIGLLGGIFVITARFGTSRDTRSQAYDNSACAEAPVNVQFRVARTDHQETGWQSGSDLNSTHLKVGQAVDVNCFARNGAALLSGATLSLQVQTNGQTTTPGLTTAGSAAEVRNLILTKAGTYTFSCRNSAQTCQDADTFTVEASTDTGSTTDTSTATTSAACTYDLNHDGKATPEDYRLFLEQYQVQLQKQTTL